MPDHRIDVLVADRRDQSERIAHQIGQAERGEIAVIIRAPARGAAIAALVRCDHVIAGGGEDRHHLAPGKRQLRKAVQQ